MKLYFYVLILISVFLSCNNKEEKVKPKYSQVIDFTLEASPTKVDYFEGETLDLTNVVVMISYDNGNTIEVRHNEFQTRDISCSIENGEILTLATAKEIKITHEASGKSVQIPISITEVFVRDMRPNAEPVKLDYFTGETLDLSGISVKLYYNNNDILIVGFGDFDDYNIECIPSHGSVLKDSVYNVVVINTEINDSINQYINVFNGTVTDNEGNIYKTAKIGSKIWMAEDLRTSKYNNGDDIKTTDPIDLNISMETEPKYQWACNGDENNVEVYGRLYTWHVVNDSRGICPTGWHVPGYYEWEALVDYLGGESIAADKLKEVGDEHWKTFYTGATNESTFTSLPSGIRKNSFMGFNFWCGWWSSTEEDNSSAWCRSALDDEAHLLNYKELKYYGYSVRCLKD